MTDELIPGGSVIGAIAAVFLLLMSSWSLGSAFCRLVMRVPAADQPGAWLSTVMGLNLTGLIALALSTIPVLSGMLWVVGMAFVAASGVILAGLNCFRIPRNASNALLTSAQRTTAAGSLGAPGVTASWLKWFRSHALLIFGGLFTLGAALCYPSGWDELVYHHVVPHRWMQQGHSSVDTDLPYSGFPSLEAFVCWIIAPVDSVIAPRLLVWCVWMLSLLMLQKSLRTVVSDGTASVVTACCMFSPVSLLVSANCYAETWIVMNLSAMLLMMTGGFASSGSESKQACRPSVTVIVLLGVLCGGAAAVKLTGITLVVLPACWLLLVPRVAVSRFWARAGQLAILVSVTALFALPFYGRAAWATGNLFYPYYAAFFGGSASVRQMSEYHFDLAASGFGDHSARGFLAGPALLAFSELLYDGQFGWQLLIFLGAGLLAFLPDTAHRSSLENRRTWSLSAASIYVAWFLTAQQARFALPFFVLTAALCCEGLSRTRPHVRRLLTVLLAAAAIAAFPIRTLGYYLGSWETVCGFWTWREYVHDGTKPDYVPLIDALQQVTPEDARLALLFEHRTFFLPRRATIVTPFFQPAGFTPPEDFATSEDVVAMLQDLGATHLLMARHPIGPDPAPDWWSRLGPLLQGIDQAVNERQLRQVWESELYLLFELHDGE